ncbi:MAG: phenylalanine--tRNA ligase subunit beta, partial [Chloroflexi bacterium]|nr:phenylalanine--tRNA ligase subunit beta [Chloroflexota bacterium]
MLVPLSWLKDYIDIVLPVDELAQRLTMAGLEVTSIQRSGQGWEKIYVGEVVEVRPHPNADRLVIAMVDDGSGSPKRAITGAPNIKVGDRGLKVAFAQLGATLIDGHSTEGRRFPVQPATIRGVASEGVICSEKELGLSDDHSAVLIMEKDAPRGVPLAEVLGDVILEIEILPNIARCTSILGVAREVAALTGQRVRYPSWDVVMEGSPIEDQVEVMIQEPELNPRFMAALIQGVKIQPSPAWLQRRLRLVGMRPINNIVDVTNYVMLETGQPSHAFDYDVLLQRAASSTGSAGRSRIITRLARPGETLRTLDGAVRDLQPFNILVADSAGPLSLGGIMGGAESEVHAGSTNILLEAAAWNLINIRRSAQTQRIESEAAYRFSRGVHPALAEQGVRRGAELMRQLAGGRVARGFIDPYPGRREPPVVELSLAEVQRSLGMDLDLARVRSTLDSLEFQCEPSAGQALRVTVPEHRQDIGAGTADLIEEVARIIGYDQIPVTRMRDELPPQRRNRALEGETRVRDILVGCGLQEVITYSLTHEESVAKLYQGSPPRQEHIRLANPISSERVILRRTLLNSLLENLSLNLKHRDRVAVFEIGRVYLPEAGDGLLPAEPRRLAIAMAGLRTPRSWTESSPAILDFFDLKGVIETLLDRLSLPPPNFVALDSLIFHPGRAA